MKADEIRNSFIEFFQEKGHTKVRSAPVVPQNDPTLLFTNAGMNQFKDVFLGTGTRPYSRAVDSQKCIRVSGKHNDLDEVGRDSSHHTFFEMMGNWSFGDYYKKEAIAWAWELITEVWKLPKDKLWATIFREDDEAEELWKKVTDIKPSQVLRFDEKENFWEMGEVGPCGPCSEIHIDLGEKSCDRKGVPGHTCKVNGNCSRFIELWNLVFIQYNRDEKGELTTLPSKHVDTGLGLERAVAVLQNKNSNYMTDLFTPIFQHISEITGRSWEDKNNITSFRVIADHIRSLTFAITDGVIPSNEGRGYVIRRILRRAARFGRNLGMDNPFIYKLVSTVVDLLGDTYPEIKERAQHTTIIIKSEEERFNEVLDRGIEMFEDMSSKYLKKNIKTVSGKDVFKLYDTFGFPVDLTELMAEEKGLKIDQKGFQTLLEEQREQARKADAFTTEEKGEWKEITRGEHSVFRGYDTLEQETEVRKIRSEGDGIAVLLAETPFYGESGGQVGDKGQIIGRDFIIQVSDTQKEGDMILHLGKWKKGSKISDPKVTAKVKEDERKSTARNHTATHILHKVLKEELGDHVNQSGSLVNPKRLRFDFTHYNPITPVELDEIERKVNEAVRKDMEVDNFITTLEDAKEQGAVALFGEKYEDKVRVLKIDDFSMELCGGTHIFRTGEIGYFRITHEEGVAAGVRRIEAVTGKEADRLLRREKEQLAEISGMLNVPVREISFRIESLIQDKKNLEKKAKKLQTRSSFSDVADKLKDPDTVQGFKVVSSRVEVDSIDELRNLGDRLRDKLVSGVGVLGTVMDNKVHFVCVVTDDLIKDKGIKAGNIVREVAAVAGGKGGGKPHQALAGGKNTDKLQEALDKVVEVVKSLGS